MYTVICSLGFFSPGEDAHGIALSRRGNSSGDDPQSRKDSVVVADLIEMDLISIGQLVARRADKSFVRPPGRPSAG